MIDDDDAPRQFAGRKPRAVKPISISEGPDTPERRAARLYGINEDTPAIERFERLVLLDLARADVIEVLDIDDETYDAMYDEIRIRWESVGEEPSEDEKRIARGRAIRSLEIMRARLARLGEDPRTQQSLYDIEMRLLKLRNLEQAVQTAEKTQQQDILERTLDEATPEQLALIVELFRDA